MTLALIVVLLALAALASAAEAAVLSADRGRLESRAEAGDLRAAAAMRLRTHPEALLAATETVVTLAGCLVAALVAAHAAHAWSSPPSLPGVPAWARPLAGPLAAALGAAGAAFAVLVLADRVPRSLAAHRADRLALQAALPAELLAAAVRPSTGVVAGAARLVLRLVGQSDAELRPRRSLEEVRAIVREAEEQGVVDGDLLSSAVEFQDRQVREVLTPRTRVRSLAVGTAMEDAIRLLSESGHSRFPVYEGTLDNVVGIAYARDLYEAARRGGTLDLRQLMRPALIVPEVKSATSLLAEMRGAHVQMAVVVDEHGSTAGVVTLEDLVEVIVGEIHDEHDTPVDLVRTLAPGVLEVEGSVAIHLLDTDHGLDLPESPAYVTLAGLLLDRLGQIPQGGEVVEIPPYRLTVVAMHGHRVARVRLERLEAAPPPEA